MALTDIFITDPLTKRAKRLAEIERQQLEIYNEIKSLRHTAHRLRREWDQVKLEAKQIKKYGQVKKAP